MSNRTLTRIPLNIFAIASLGVLAACGGGGGGGGGSSTEPSPQPSLPPAQQMSFTVSLDAIDVRRASSGESIAVDTAGVTQSLTLEQ
jgi:hypothetical protein